jgi:uncharacterized repeat protein (TIGR01451 family)
VKTLASVNGTPAGPTTEVGPGDVLVYHIVVTDTGGSQAMTTLTDTVPGGTTYTGPAAEGWTCAPDDNAGSTCTQVVTVTANSSTTLSFTVTVAAALPAGDTRIVNTVTSSTGTCSACTVTTPTVASLDVVKTLASVNGTPAGPVTTVGPNDVLVYQIAATNSGGSPGSTTLTETVPVNTTFTGALSEGWTCTPNQNADSTCTHDVTVAGGATVPVLFTVTVAASLPAGTTIIGNTVTSSKGTCSSCTLTNPTVANLDAVKSLAEVNGTPVSAISTVAPHDVLLYNITVTNSGGSPGTTTVTETVPPNTTFGSATDGWTCNANAAGSTCAQDVTVAGNSSATVAFEVTVGSSLPVGAANIVNTVTSSTGTCSRCTVATPTDPKLDTVKILFSVNGVPARPTARVGPNDELVYHLTVTNGGGSGASTTLTDTVPAQTTFTGAGWRCSPNNDAGSPCTQDVTVAGPGSTTVLFTVKVATSLPAGTTEIVNTVTSTEGTCSVCTVRDPTVASTPPPTPAPPTTAPATPAPPTHSQASPAPPTPSEAAPAPAPLSTGPSGALPFTGFLLSNFLWFAAALLGIGTGLVLMARRQRAIHRR